MRIGLLTSVPETLEAFFLPWISRWNEMGLTVFPASGPGPMTSRPPRYEAIPGITQTPRLEIIRGAKHLRQWCEANRLDVVLTSTATASAASRLRQLPCPVVYFCHGLHWSAEQHGSRSYFEFAEKLLLTRASGVISMNSEDREWFSTHASERPQLFLRYGVGLDLRAWPLTKPHTPKEPIRLVWIGAMTPRKRPMDALAIVEDLNNRGLSVKLDMLGDGALFALVRQKAQQLDGIQLHGQTRVLPHLQRAHGVLHTAEWEGLPRVLLEAAAVGRPSFGYDVKGVRDAPGVMVADSQGTPVKLADLVAQWADGSVKEPPVQRSDLQWTMAQDSVLDFILQIAEPSSRSLIQ